MKHLLRVLPILFLLLFVGPHFAHASLLTNLVSYWKLDESSGNAADSKGSNTLTNTGVTYGTGIINNGAVYNAGTDQLSITNASQTGLNFTTDWSSSFWVFLTSAPANNAYYYLFGKTLAPGNNREYLAYYSQDSSVFHFNFESTDLGTANNNSFVLTKTLSTGSWHHIVTTYNITTTKFNAYFDGVAFGEQTGTSAGAPFAGTGPFAIGADPEDTSPTPNMTIDEFGLWSRVLTQAEVTSLYNAGVGCQYTFASCTAAAVSDFGKLIFFGWF